MTALPRIDDILARFPVAATAAYAALVAAFVVTTAVTLADLVERRDAVAEAAEGLARLEGRSAARARAAEQAAATVPPGSPFLEGATVSVSGASLLQRVSAATKQVGASILSSQVDLDGSRVKPGFVAVTVSCEMAPGALQALLYDLEAGMPFLFVDQLVVQVPTAATAAPDGKMRVMLTVSGQWGGGK